MSLENRLRRGLPGLVAEVEDPDGSVQKVLASSRMRYRRRRTFGVLGTTLLLAGGTVLALADRDHEPSTQVLAVTITATTVPAARGATGGASSGATTGVTGVVSTSTTPCRAPLLVTKLPADYLAPLVVTDGAGWSVSGAAGRRVAIAAGSALAKPAGAVARTVDLPALGTKAELTGGADGSLLATIAMPDDRCGPNVSLLAQGMSEADLIVVLGGLRNESECSAKGFLSASGAPGVALPAAVAATRTKVRAAASACDFDGLAALARANPSFVAELPGVDLADQWRFADARGNQFMRAVAGLVDLVPRRTDSSIKAGSPSWVWPSFAFDDPKTKLVDADFATLDRVFGAGYGARFRGEYRKATLADLAESYIGGLFVEIRADGALAAITTR